MKNIPLLLLLLLPLTAFSQEVLMIGNSYSAGTQSYLQNFFNNAPTPCKLTLKTITPGGQTLYGHYTTTSTLGDINTGNYAHIILQDQSQQHTLARATFEASPGITDAQNFFQQYQSAYIPPETANQSWNDARTYWGSKQLLDYINASGSATAQVHIFQTWARNPSVANTDLAWLSGTAEQKTQRHLEHNILMARDMLYLDPDATIARVGEAWAQSLSAAPTITLYSGDGSHGSANGYYLSAAILYQQITGLPASENPYNGGLSTTTETHLKNIASTYHTDPAFNITDFQRATNGTITLTWNCRPCTEYYIESSPDLQTWTEVPGTRGFTPQKTNSSTKIFSDTGSRKFFRIAHTSP